MTPPRGTHGISRRRQQHLLQRLIQCWNDPDFTVVVHFWLIGFDINAIAQFDSLFCTNQKLTISHKMFFSLFSVAYLPKSAVGTQHHCSFTGMFFAMSLLLMLYILISKQVLLMLCAGRINLFQCFCIFFHHKRKKTGEKYMEQAFMKTLNIMKPHNMLCLHGESHIHLFLCPSRTPYSSPSSLQNISPDWLTLNVFKLHACRRTGIAMLCCMHVTVGTDNCH